MQQRFFDFTLSGLLDLRLAFDPLYRDRHLRFIELYVRKAGARKGGGPR
jgi:hypothetical protein